MAHTEGIPIHGVDPTHLAEIMDLAELADSKPEYRLAVVDFSESSFVMADGVPRYRVVKMEGQPIDKHGATVP